MSWLEKLLPPKIQQTDPSERRTVPEGLWIKCPSCETVLYKTDLEQNINVGPKCAHHHRIGARSRLDAFLDAEGRYEASLSVLAPVTSLCPCSKEISDYGAHNQRSHITIEAVLDGALSIEELVAIAEKQASCEVYGLLKRPDEKYVTERAYDNPKFVEDLVRDIALALNAEPRIAAYTVESENFESIHNHSAYALIRHDNRV